MMICEMCGKPPVMWHQTRPVDRWLCDPCAVEDQRATYPDKRWCGICDPDFASIANG